MKIMTISLCSRASLALADACIKVPTKEDKIIMAGWTSEVVSGMLTLGGWQGMEWWAKVRVKNEGRAQVKQQQWILPAQTLGSARNCHSSLSYHCKTTPAKISLELVDLSLWKLV